MKFKVVSYTKSLYLEKKTIEVEANNQEEAFELSEKLTCDQYDAGLYWDDIEILETEVLEFSNVFFESDEEKFEDQFEDYNDIFDEEDKSAVNVTRKISLDNVCSVRMED